MAIISLAAIVAAGEQIDVKGPTARNRILATFTDSNAPGRPGDYSAAVDWGDGVVSKGVISKVADGSFVVRGTHTYKDAEPFSISVRIRKGANLASDAYAWSTANVFGFKPMPHLPPFPVVHLVAAWNSGPSKTVTNSLTGTSLTPSELTETLSGSMSVVNAGQRISPPSKLRFWLSNNQSLDVSDTPLTVNALSQIVVAPFASGKGGQGNFTVALPKGQSGTGKYLLAELVYADPIIDGSLGVEKVVVKGPIDPSVVAYDLVADLGRAPSGEYLTREDGMKATFRVLLDTQPTANVTINLTSSLTTEGTVSPASLTFNSSNWNSGQLVTVTGVNDGTVKDGNKAFKVKIEAPTEHRPKLHRPRRIRTSLHQSRQRLT